MKKNILVQVGTKIETKTRSVYDADGNESIETYEVEVPIMESQYVEMTEAEIAEMQTEEIEVEPSIEEQLADLTELVGVLTEVICND